MSDAAQPSFEDIFGEAFPSDREIAPAGLASADLEEVLAIRTPDIEPGAGVVVAA